MSRNNLPLDVFNYMKSGYLSKLPAALFQEEVNKNLITDFSKLPNQRQHIAPSVGAGC